MSIDVNWRSATSGPDGEALAERIRSFVHDRFQQVALPRFIRSVQVHAFDFGTIPPELEIKDFCEPFADFYEEDDDDHTSDASEELGSEHSSQWNRTRPEINEPSYREDPAVNHSLRDPFPDGFPASPLRSPLGEHLNHHFLPRAGTPGIPGGTSTLGYHLMSLGGLSGTQTPLAAVAGGNPFASGWSDSGMGPGNRGRVERHAGMQHQRAEPEIDTSNSTSRPSTANTLPSHPSGSTKNSGEGATGRNDHSSLHAGEHLEDPVTPGHLPLPPRMRERRPEDFQVLCHVKYAGDVRLSLTAEILLDYPMPSFVGLPLKLNVTGITFDGVAVIAYIRKRVHFCFLSAEDADALIGSEQQQQQQQESAGDDHRPQSRPDSSASASQKRHGGLLQEIRVESEIGRKEDGKQVLKNVGKVERFVLAQVRRIFEEELVYPSFWTFLI
ncbi:mitochondrial distribution and morphology protein 12 [Aspergillus lentulus]|uniref:Mitochondrial distribution and morphology protein 12 n=1 Tax=Aspergillus lentulus TaxID=293939 RepID=A0AAN4PPC0_ASPLE|nr:mitochondrial distribution and morphology protein 12 [Aspergillus lentulus]GAQ10482.1 mitochondrial distribution and morphology protein 12 [Aspergillus lentulus]GFF46903.1 mitochondrial distribution and morphology protein 12 [Aspergillus lentulus]GFF91323.1 mitochondrial distribution and morphology protein 12 [Aspergillus lentulus]